MYFIQAIVQHGSCKIIIKKIGSRLAERILSEHLEEEFVDILMTVIKTKLAFFQMEIEAMLVNVTEANQSSLAKAQKLSIPLI